MRLPWARLVSAVGLIVLAVAVGFSAATAFGFRDHDSGVVAVCEDFARAYPVAERREVVAACVRSSRPTDLLGPLDDEVGVVCVGLGVLIGVGALLCAYGALQQRRHTSSRPRRWLFVFTHVPEVAGGLTRGVAGTVVSSPSLRAPMTQRPCVAWGLRLSRHNQEPDVDSWRTVWHQEQVQDLEIAYDLRLTHDARRGLPERGDFAPQPGTVDIASDMIEVASLHTGGVSQEVALDSQALSQLVVLGVTGDLRQDISTDASRYRLVEDCLSTGEFAQCSQNGYNTTFSLLAGHQEDGRSGCLGLAVLLLYISLFVLILGFGLINGWHGWSD